MNRVVEVVQALFDRRRERRLAELREELYHARDRFHQRPLEKELAASMAARSDQRVRAISIVRMMQGQRHE